MVILVKSAGFEGGNYAHIYVDGQEVPMKSNINGHFRGLHIVLINPESGQNICQGIFDTYKSSDQFEAFLREQPPIPAGTIVIAACKDDCVTNLSEIGKKWFSSMGSNYI